jgi:uncharacterized membrane protein YgaE (UPF0421/DUF939 family)
MKTLFLIGILLTILFACHNPQSENKLMEKQLKIEHNKAQVRKWILEGWNQNQNKEIVADIFAQVENGKFVESWNERELE